MQWQDKSSYHNKMAVRTYEDDAQQLDPAFHLIGEVERQFADRIAVEEFRKGTEVKFSISDKRPAHYNYRFWKDKQSNRIHVECYKNMQTLYAYMLQISH